MTYTNNKGADQPTHPRSLISTFVVCFLDSMICILAISKVLRFYLASVAAQPGLNLTWWKIPEDTFSRDVARLYVYYDVLVLCSSCWDLVYISSAECYYRVLFFEKKWVLYTIGIGINFLSPQQLRCCIFSGGIYKLFSLASMPKKWLYINAIVFYVHLNQWNESIKKGLVMWLLRSHEHILLCHWFSTTVHQLY